MHLYGCFFYIYMSDNKNQKIEKTAKLSQSVKDSKVIVLTDYTGLNVSQINDLRSKIKEAGGTFEVSKNTLLRIALGLDKDSKSELAEKLNGPTAVLFGMADEVAAVKALVQFSKANGLPNIKLAVLGDQTISPEEVSKLANLPAKEILIGKLLGQLNAPITSLVFVLQGNTRKLVYLLSEIAKQKAN
jgi:large subunit ribosomal protein L10